MQYFPKRQNKHALLGTLLLFILAILGFVGSGYAPAYPALWQLFGLGAAVSAILLIQKFLLTSYIYILTDPENLDRRNELTIIRILGNKRALAARIPLGRIVALVPAAELTGALKVIGLHTAARANFCVDLFPQSAWAIVLVDNRQCAVVLLQCDDSFICELKSRIPSNFYGGTKPPHT